MMDSETEELYFQKIHELVQDDDKIVTIPFLANTLNISIQESQQLIDKYVSDNLKLKEELGVSRILTGTLKDGNQKTIMRVKDDELEGKLALFENVLSNVIFSVQKSKHVDFSIIALVDQLNSTNIREKALVGSIVGRNCKKRVLNFKKLPTLPTPTIKGKSSFFMPKVDSKSNEKATSKSSEKQSVESKPDVKSKSNGIANMFSKMPAKAEATASKDNKPAPKPQGGLSNFLSKNSSKSSNKGSDSKSNSNKENGLNISSSMEFNSEASIKVEDLTSFMEVDMDEGESEEQENKVPLKEKKESSKVNEKEDVKKNKQKRKSTKRQRDRSEESSNKRRKRIVVQDDSDSDDLFEKEAEDEDVIGRSDEEPQRVASPIAKKPLPPKNKRRKAVDKTYVDDEGFVVTQTEYVYETASEDEKEVEEKPKEEKKEPSKPLQKKSSASSENDNSSPQRGGKGKKGKKNAAPQNQPTLMNFFKKK